MKPLFFCFLFSLLLENNAFSQDRPEQSGAVLNKYLLTGEPKLPEFYPFMDLRLRDPFITTGPDKYYYLTGTLPYNKKDSTVNEGIPLWRSKDLKNWESMGLIWSFDRDGTWQAKWTEKNGNPRRALWAPEIHYINKNWYVVYTVTGLGMGMMKSTTGLPQGPYKSVNDPDGPIVASGIDASLFQDDDGKVYFIWGSGMIAEMNDALTGFTEKPVRLRPTVIDTVAANHYADKSCKEFDHVGFEGASIFKKNGKYYLSCADRYHGYYHNLTAESDNIKGPYTARYVSVPFCGHGSILKDFNGAYWWTYFGNDKVSPFQKPAVLPVTFDTDGHLMPKNR